LDETSGVLRPVIEAYLLGKPLDAGQIATMRAYLRQWIAGDGWWPDDDINWLRAHVDELDTQDKIRAWIARSDAACVDPL
jgi:uncharacterized membrane-anchored protein